MTLSVLCPDYLLFSSLCITDPIYSDNGSWILLVWENNVWFFFWFIGCLHFVAALKTSDAVIEGSVSTGEQYGMHTETQNCTAIPEEGYYTLYASTQVMTGTLNSAAQVLGINANMWVVLSVLTEVIKRRTLCDLLMWDLPMWDLPMWDLIM